MGPHKSIRNIQRLLSFYSKRALATHSSLQDKDCTSLTPPYPLLPLSLAEKILFSHLDDPSKSLDGAGANGIVRGERYLQLKPARVAMQDASAQQVFPHFDILLQFMTCGLPSTAVSASIHCDHLIQANVGAATDLKRSIENNIEVFNFLESAAKKYVGGADAVDAMTGTPWELKAPNIVGIHLTGTMSGWTTPKDGGTGRILEYFGPGVHAQSATGLATIANMGAEVGATTSTFPYTENMGRYLRATRRGPVAEAASWAAKRGFLRADEGVEYDESIEINLSELEPTINGPFTPDLATPLSKFGSFVAENGLIGSCTNSSYEDMTRVASIARQAKSAGLKAKVPFLCTPGSEQIRATIERDGLTDVLQDVGAVVLANACGPCIGQWKRDEKKGEDNESLYSNFKGRNDGNSKTMNFLASPEIVTAMAFSGDLTFNPMTDSLIDTHGQPFKFDPPSGSNLPENGFEPGKTAYTPPPSPIPHPETEVIISPASTRLEALKPFPSHFTGTNLELPTMEVLMRVRGKCTTDHISAAGPWLKFKGHLTNISENTLFTATNDENGQVNVVVDHLTGEETSIPDLAKRFKMRSQPWALIVDQNYGEGSAREHAAMQPRFLGGSLIKQGILPLWFVNKEDYSLISSGDLIQTVGLDDVFNGIPGATIKLKVTKRPQQSDVKGAGLEVILIETRHTMSPDQLNWLRAGSALNFIREQ
ncbi:uncharacterized protein EI90DRAFT_3144323 [Cantharellus anzutake]|uniref:uncharacterized protein n=1 Tax=Cantharellus anzutake TaxID=1750568 RepID=UPI001907A708|nr:uncharacterized protein EI90DRAFT_3144323 [Cantharellus anzutake]KAF8337925.1 hypothetical protein EI90DRAFT_3144323 [Cantharellus anzutake]